MDKDSSLYDVAKGFYLDALNITKNDISANNDYAAANVIGTRAATYSLPTGTNKCIGAFGFELRNTVIYFVRNSLGNHSVLEFNATTRATTKIFESKTDSDGIDILGFLEDNKITSINVYPRDEGDLLFFLDSLGRPTQMDITLFKAGTYTPVTRAILDKGKKPPLSPPSVVYDNDTTRRSNNLRNKLFRFKYRWIYDDFEKSTFSPISIVALPVSILSDIYTNVITNNNVIRMSMNTGDKNVKSVEVAMSYVEKTNDWSDFQSVEVVDKSMLVLTQTTEVKTFLTYRIITTFSGTVLQDTVINIYATQLPSTPVLIASYTALLGDTIADVGAGLVASAASIGITTSEGFAGNQLILHLNDATHIFNRVDIIPAVDPDVDNIDFAFPFYNDSTYPDIDINESIELFDYVPDKANAQEMPNGNVLAYAGITEGYNKDTTEDAIVSVNVVSAGNGGVVGSLSATWVRRADIPPFFFVMDATFSGIPATGTVINLKLKRSSDHTIITGGTYTTVAGDTIYTIVAAINYSAPNVTVTTRTGATFKSAIGMGAYESFPLSTDYMRVEIVPPTTASATNSIATWKWSTERNIGRLYFDEKGKTNGILYTDKVTFPAYDEDVSDVPLIPYVNYKINDIPPDWAYSMQFAVTKDYTQYIFWESIEVKTETDYIYFNISSFITNASKKPTTAEVLSYAFQDGDRVRVIKDIAGTVFNDTYDAAIEGVVVDPSINSIIVTGTFLKIKNVAPFTGAILTSTNYVLEIYRPTQQAANAKNQVYYEFGEQYPIIDPTLPSRRHSGEVTDQVVGITPAEFNFYEGDAYFRSRTIATTDTGYATFNVMDRNFVDFYISAVSSIDGRPNIIDINARRQYYSTLIRFGQAYQANTNINGLNRFYPNNFDEYDYNYGDVVRLKVRDRYIKVFQKFKIGTVPLYNQITKDASGNNVLVVTDRLLNPIQYHVGNFGLSAPESLASWHFADYGCDTAKGVIWRDSNDGVMPISVLYKVDSWATVELPLRTNGSKIYGAIDPKANQYIAALEAYEYQLPYFSIEATGLNEINSGFTIISSSDFTVNWGDGTTDSFVAGTRTPTHVYSSPYTGAIKISSANLGGITSININGDISDINPASNSLIIATSELQKLTGLLSLVAGDCVFLDGVASNLPALMTFLVTTNNNLSGNVVNLPRGLNHVLIQGNNSLSGTVANLPLGLTYLILYGVNTLTGNVTELPTGLTILYLYGNNTLSGNVSDLPTGLIECGLHGYTTLTGDIIGLPSTLSAIDFSGNNTMSGDISDLPSGVITVTISGVNTLAGDITTMPNSILFIQILGNNTLSGDLAFIPAAIKFINVGSSTCTVNTYTSGVRTWIVPMNSVKLSPGSGGFSTTDVDNILIELAAQVTSWIPDKIVSLLGSSSSRSAASDAAVTTLISRGVTINTN